MGHGRMAERQRWNRPPRPPPPPPAACWPCPHESWASLGFDSTLITVLRHWVLETAEEGGCH